MLGSPPEPERRRSAREPARTSAMLRGISTQVEATIVQICDVSESGVGFRMMSPLDVGSVHRFDICDRSKRRPGGARAEVRSCRMLPGGAFHIGAQFC